MKSHFHIRVLVILLSLATSPVYADEDDTMVVVDEGATPEDIVKVITLPLFVPVSAQENAAPGQETANQAKNLGSELGQQTADEAKSNRESISEEVRQGAGRDARRDNNERGRGPDG